MTKPLPLTDEMKAVLIVLAEHQKVPADYFNGRGFLVNGLVRRGYAEWIRANPKTLKATALRVTELGNSALQQTPGA